MTELEHLISRYFDGDLTARESEAFHELLASSQEARDVLRDMEAHRHAARRLPVLTQPSAALESELFQQLFAEESVEEEVEDRAPVVSLFSRFVGTARRAAVLVPALLLLGLGGGYFLMQNSPTDSATLADAVRPAAGPTSSSSGIASDRTTPNTESARPTISERSSTVRASEAVAEGTTPRNNVAGIAAERQSRTSEASFIGSDISEPDQSRSEPENRDAFANASREHSGSAEWAAIDLLNTAENTSEDSEPDNSAIAQTIETLNRTREPMHPYAFSSGRRDDGDGISATSRVGVAYIQGPKEDLSTPEFSFSVEGRFDGRHRLALSVGQSPMLIERTTISTLTSIRDEKGGPSIASERVEYTSRLIDEVWAGIGYGYALVSTDIVRVEPGFSVGVGERSLRMNVEMPVRVKVAERLSVNVAGMYSRVQPHDTAPRDVERDYDNAINLSIDEDQDLDFTSWGAYVGLSFDI